MKVINQWIIYIPNKFQIIYQTEEGYFITSNGPLDSRGIHIKQIEYSEVELLLKIDK